MLSIQSMTTKILTNKKHFLFIVGLFFLVPGLINPVWAGDKDNPLLTKVIIDQLEVRTADSSNSNVLAAQAWLGKDINKLWFKADIQRDESETQEAELQVLFSRAVAPYWDFQLGLRQDAKPSPSRSWAVIGFQGLAPYFFEVDGALLIGESGRTAFQLSVEYELLLTQRLILTPELDVNLYGQNDIDLGIGSGLADLEAGLRLRYQICREFAPYIGVNWHKSFGNTADFARSAGQDVNDMQWVVGLRGWF